MPEQVIRIADAEQCRDNLEVQFGGYLFDALHITEIARVHVAKPGELGIGQQHVGVAGPGGAAEQRFEFVDLVVHGEVLRGIDPAFRHRCARPRAGQHDQQGGDRGCKAASHRVLP